MNALRITVTKTANKYLRYWCIEERMDEPNPLDIWHIVVPWSRDHESIELQFCELTNDAECRCVREDGETRFNINCAIHGKAP